MLLKRLLSFLLICAILFSCTPKDQPVTKEEAVALAKTIDSSINNKKPAAFNDLLNEQIFAEHIASHSDVKVTSDLIAGVKKGLENANLGDQIIRAMADDGSYKLVKQYEKDKVQHLLFRLYSTNGLNYHDFTLTKRKDKVYIGDIFIYLVGDEFSSILSDLIKTVIDQGSAKSADQTMEKINQIRRLMNEERYEEAKRQFDALPVAVRERKLMVVTGIQLASKLGDEAYLKELDSFKQKFPNEANVFLLLIDAYILHKDYDQAMESVNKLDALIDKDPFLDYYRGLVSNLQKRPEEARKYLERLQASMPEFGDGTLELIANYLEAKDYEKARPLVTSYKQNPRFNQQTLSYVMNGYPDFETGTDAAQ